MKKNLLLFLFSLLFITACKKEDGCLPNPIANERNAIINYCNTNGITYTEHSSGIFYQIINPGAGVTPDLNSKIFIFYTGRLLNGTQFDYQSDPTRTGWTLKSLIEGWQIALPLIQKGGRIKVVIPSALAYGCKEYATIPPNSPLFFDITLTEVQ
jgi:FKBP-type peptidyl-prolyl cis-trans isomerase